MGILPDYSCPFCNKKMLEYLNTVKKVTKFEDCVRRCIACQIGVSNSRENPTVIHQIKEKNFPETVLDGMNEVLSNALNVKNRQNKINRMAFETSEDAFTWVFIRHFSREENITHLEKILGIQGEISDILLWGVSILHSSSASTEKLKSVCQKYNEKPTRYSEPDVIIETDKEVVFIEVKLKSGNAVEKRTEKFDSYISPRYYKDRSAVSAKQTTLYLKLNVLLFSVAVILPDLGVPIFHICVIGFYRS